MTRRARGARRPRRAGSPRSVHSVGAVNLVAAILLTATLVAASLVAASLLAPAPAAAQTVTGTVRDRDHGRPLAGASLLLIDSLGVAVDSTRAGAAGQFRLTAPRAGEYNVHVHLDGWAGVPSDAFVVDPGRDRTFDPSVPLIGAAALRQMSSILDDGDLQRPIDEICGEPLRPWEAGVLLGVVRDRRTREPVAGARVEATGPDGTPLRATVSNARGNFVLCNLPADGVVVRAEAADGRQTTARPEIRAGMAAWHDLFLR